MIEMKIFSIPTYTIEQAIIIIIILIILVVVGFGLMIYKVATNKD
jgi:hypothetical protein